MGDFEWAIHIGRRFVWEICRREFHRSFLGKRVSVGEFLYGTITDFVATRSALGFSFTHKRTSPG